MGERKNGRGLWDHAVGEANLLSQRYRIPSVDLDTYAIEPAILGLVPRETCEEHRLIPVSRQLRSSSPWSSQRTLRRWRR